MSTRGNGTASGSQVRGATVGATGPDATTRTMTISELVDDIEWHKGVTRVHVEDSHTLHDDFSHLHTRSLKLLLRQRTANHVGREVTELLTTLYNLGFSWSDIARMADVSVPALRKWRHGESPNPENRRRLATVVAVCELIADRSAIIQDVAAWLEARLSPEAPVTGIDIMAAGSFDLVFRYAHEDDPERILEVFEPAWRDKYRSEIEVFIADDGMPALRPRHQDG